MILPRADTDRFRPRAMSLIELLTTVGALTLLFATLVPSLSEARREGKEVRCLSNLARIADATAVYAASDRSEIAIPVHPSLELGERSVAIYPWGGKSGRGDPLLSDPLDSQWGTKNGLGPATRPLNEVLYAATFLDYQDNRGPGNANWISDTRLDLDVFRCPADYGYAGFHFVSWRDSKLTSFDHYGNSYAARTFWARWFPGPSDLFSISSLLQPLSKVPTPARTILYMENCGHFAWRRNMGTDACGPRTPDNPSSVRGWHGKEFMINVAFSDGHASAIFTDGHGHPHPDIGRYPDLPDGSQGRYANWKCVVIRGDDWQIDTLPAEPVRTRLPPDDVDGPIE